ncbi:MAG: conjugal transfer protein TraX [Lachnospiraceae bacterium]|nr:conjugal transfer protein TraX [Lachnospiraceae bacterium]
MIPALKIPEGIKKLDGHALKMIAVVTMLIDHIGAALYYTLSELFGFADPSVRDQLYDVLRAIGRTAFPIFAFFLVEGFILTRSRFRYAVRLLIFAFLSEIPFQLAFDAEFHFGMKNVIFTLLFGLITIDCLERIGVRRLLYSPAETTVAGVFGTVILSSVTVSLMMFLAWAFDSDYDYRGVLLIVIFYLFRDMRLLALVLGYLSFLWEPWSVVGFMLLMTYNGERGKQHKYFFYVFYPAHLMLIWLLRYRLAGF